VIRLSDCLAKLPRPHRAALEWFATKQGTVQPWPKAINVDGEVIILANRLKGIYKPAWTKYALIVRQILDSPYADREPIT
jgi:hypothetical protein